MKIIVGLGNPGKEYEKTRHNVGFMVLDELRKQLTDNSEQWKQEKKMLSVVCYLLSNQALLVKPQTFMNDSGKAVIKVLRYKSIKVLNDLWVIHDDLDLELGRIKIHVGGSSGHHGIESIIKETGKSEFMKFRLGVGRPVQKADNSCYYQETKDYLLSPFTKEELLVMQPAVTKMALAVQMALHSGVEKAMNEFNV